MTGGAHEANGPKNGTAWRFPALTDESAASGNPSSRSVASAIRK